MTSVKHFHGSMDGAPALNGVAGSLIAVLDACLVNGWGLKTAASITVAGGVATATFSVVHGFAQDAIIQVAGVTPAELNGEKRVLSATPLSLTFDATGVSDGPATGAITVKIAPVGWEKAFSGTNIAVYRSRDVTGTRAYLRVDDTGTTVARVVSYESMTDVNTGVGPFPTAGQMAGGGYWPKANTATAIARTWTVVADSKTVYYHCCATEGTLGVAGLLYNFGDFTSLKSGDAFAALLTYGSVATLASGTAVEQSSIGYSSVDQIGWVVLMRSFTSLGAAIAGGRVLDGLRSTGNGNAGAVPNTLVPNYPNGPDNGLYLARQAIVEPGVAYRGRQRGVHFPLNPCAASFNYLDKIDGQGPLAGRKLLAVRHGIATSQVGAGVAFFDITGPWG